MGITVQQAAVIEDHVWALMEALGVRDSRKINQRVSEAIATVLDRQRDAFEAVPAAGEVERLRDECARMARGLRDRNRLHEALDYVVHRGSSEDDPAALLEELRDHARQALTTRSTEYSVERAQ